MNRRDVIKLGAVAAAAGTAACGLPKPVATMSGPSGGAEWNAMLDEQLTRLSTPGLLHRLAGASGKTLRPETQARLAEKDAAFRRLLSTVLITQSFRELPRDTQSAADVQARMWSHLDQINNTVYDVSDMLAALDANQRKDLRARLRAKPELPEALADALDGQATKAGLSGKRRRQLRRMMAETSFRLRHGDPSSIVDEYVAKVDRLRETSSRDAAAIDIAEKLGERSFWHAQHLAQADDPTAGAPATAPLPAPPLSPPGAPPLSPPGATPPGPVPAPSMAELLTKSARSASRHGDCATIEILRERVKTLDPAYYAANFANDPVIAACRPGVSTEPPPPPPVQPPPPEPQYDNKTPQPHPGTAGLRAGGYILGIGLIVGLGSLLIVDSGVFAGVFGITAGVILVGIGLLVLLISAIVYVADD